MRYRPQIPFPHAPACAAGAAHAQRRLTLGLLASAALHLLWLGLAHLPALPRLPSRTVDPARLTLTLAPAAPRGERQAIAVPPAATPAPPPRARERPAAPGLVTAPAHVAVVPQRTPAAGPGRATATRQSAPAARPAHPAAPPETAPASGAGPAPAPADAAAPAPLPSGADIVAAARHEAAAIARELNHAPGSKTEFRSRAQEELDRQFDAAHAAGGSWFRSARVEEITTAADGNRRVYRIVTPLGTFCRIYYGDGKEPANVKCPR